MCYICCSAAYVARRKQTSSCRHLPAYWVLYFATFPVLSFPSPRTLLPPSLQLVRYFTMLRLIQTTCVFQERISRFVVPVLRVSEIFCRRLYRQCGSAILPETRERVDLSFDSGLAFCHAVGLRTVSLADHAGPMSFSAAHPSHVSSGLVFTFVTAAVTAGVLLRSRVTASVRYS